MTISRAQTGKQLMGRGGGTSMPIRKVKGGWTFSSSGRPLYKTLAAAKRAYKAYLAKKNA
jgi:hypothetical protein|tara:strand:- start:339 stop:518 length:180 start_codon:yes stop_codon:yes gene_type:complete